MNWRKWRMGMLIATLNALAVAGSTAIVGGDWKTFVASFCTAWISVGGAYLQRHPIENIQDTVIIKKGQI